MVWIEEILTWSWNNPNVLTNLIIPIHLKNFTWSHYSWWRSKSLFNNGLLILGFVPWPHSSYNWRYYYFCSYQTLIEIIIVFVHISWTDGVLWLYLSGMDKGRNPECLVTTALLVSTLLLFTNYFPLKVFLNCHIQQ